MPPRYVQTVRQLIYWQYAHLIARAAGFENNYGFIVSRYKKLDSGEMKWSSSVHDHEKELDKGRVCVYCDAREGLSTDHIVPISRAGVDPRIERLLDSSDNCVCACKSCNSSKSDRDVFEWYGPDRVDEIPKLVLSKFLKLAYQIHETQGTLDVKDPNMDGVLDIYDLGVVITHLISKISEKSRKEDAAPPGRNSSVLTIVRTHGKYQGPVRSSPVKLDERPDERSSWVNDWTNGPVKSSLRNDLALLAGRTVKPSPV